MSRFDRDRDGVVSDAELAALNPPRRWSRFGLRGPVIVLLWLTRNVKRIAVLVVGLAVLVAGAAMLVLPGPGILVLIVGLAILATEFVWAERVLDRATANASRAASRVTAARNGRLALIVSSLALLTGGATLVVVAERPIVGVGILLAGVSGLAALLPVVQTRLARTQSGPQRSIPLEADFSNDNQPTPTKNET